MHLHVILSSQTVSCVCGPCRLMAGFYDMVAHMSDVPNQSGGLEQSPPSFPSGTPPELAPTKERLVSFAAITAIVGAAALVMGGIVGYLFGDWLSESDVTMSGKISYACAIVEKVREDHSNEDDWGNFGETDSYNDVGAISALLGAFVPLVDSEEKTFATLGGDILPALQAGQLDDLNTTLEAIETECETR